MSECTNCLIGEEDLIDKERITNILPFIPYNILKRFGDRNKCCVFENRIDSFEGTVVYFDIVDFSNWVFSFIKDESKGVEEVNKILTEYYTRFINPIRRLGGTVYQFAGDSILVGFPNVENESSLENINRALSAISDFYIKIKYLNHEVMLKNSHEIKFRIGVSYGTYNEVIIGSDDHSYQAVVIGNTIDEAIKAERLTNINRICISETVHDLKSFTNLKKVDPQGYYILKDHIFENIDFEEVFNTSEMMKNPKFFKRCKQYINKEVYKRAISGYKILHSEHREITCLLIRFDGTDYKNQIKESVNKLNSFYKLIQEEADRYGGVLLNPDLSDKGNVFIVVFGAPKALEKKENFALQLALKLKENYSTYGFINKLYCGISTGRAYCGDFGSMVRKDYSIIGNVINIAARLMTHSEECGIYIDKRTKDRLDDEYVLSDMGTVTLKGIKDDINIFEVTQRLIASRENEHIENDVQIIGREKELQFISTRYNTSLDKNGNCLGIIADAGVGKTLLANSFLSQLNTSKVKIIQGRCFLYEKNSLYYLWREILYSYFDLSLTVEKEKVIDRVTAQLQSEMGEDIKEWIPMFLKLMSIEIEESSRIKSILPELKESILFNLLGKLLVDKSYEIPLILFLEDIHWIDDKSQVLLKYLISQIGKAGIFIVYTSRNKDFVSSVSRYPQFSTLLVDNLEKDAARIFIRSIMKLKEPNEQLEDQILHASQCNPFFIDTIIKSIRDKKIIDCDESGSFYINKDIKEIEIPTSIKNVILSRIDNLDSQEQLVIKTASVIGHNFTYPTLSTIIENEVKEETDIKQSLNILESIDLMDKEEDPETSSYMFKHMSIRDVVYQTLLKDAKTRLNLALAAYLENSSSEDLFSYFERLSLHYYNGQDFEKALIYTIKSAKKASSMYAGNDAIKHLTRAVEICETLKEQNNRNYNDYLYSIELDLVKTYRLIGQFDKALSIGNECTTLYLDDLKKAELFMEMANVYQELGDMKEAISICEKALMLLGTKVPGKKQEIYYAIAQQLLIRMLSEVSFIKKNIFRGIKLEKSRLVVDILSLLTKIYYFDTLEKTAWASIFRYNIAEHMDNKAQLSFSATDYGVTMVSMGLNRAGLKHINRGINLAGKQADIKNQAICQSRESLYYLFNNDSYKSIKILEKAVSTFRSIGEMWELMTALGTIGQNYYNVCEYEKSIEAYTEADKLAKKLDSLPHQAWKYCKVSFLNYIKGDISYSEAVKGLYKAIEISSKARDTMNLCITYGHLIEIAILEDDLEVIPELADKIIDSNKNYSVDLPHIRISLIYALEGLLAINHKSGLKRVKKLLKCVNKLSKRYSFLTGPGLRAKSKYYLLAGNRKKAKEYLTMSLNSLEKSPYQRDYALSLLQATDLFNEKSDVYSREAKSILLRLGLGNDL